MTKFSTDAVGGMSTQSSPFGRELDVRMTKHSGLPTDAYAVVGSVPTAEPEAQSAGQDGYAFRISGEQRRDKVTITINTNRLIERAKVRQLNEEIRRAIRR